MRLEGIENLLNIILVLKEINLTDTRVIIDEANIILIPSRGGNRWPPKHQNELTQEA